MSFNRLYVGAKVDQYLRNLKGRTGLTPNLICRYGFCLSLNEPWVPDPNLFSDGSVREFNRYTLTGQWDHLFMGLLRERLFADGLDPVEDLESQFKAHLSRGVEILNTRVKRLEDIGELMPPSFSKAP